MLHASQHFASESYELGSEQRQVKYPAAIATVSTQGLQPLQEESHKTKIMRDGGPHPKKRDSTLQNGRKQIIRN